MLDLQRRHRRLGKIRLGKKGDKGQPQKLTTIRLTSPNRELIYEAAELWGGDVRPWGDHQFEVITEAESIPVMVPSQEISQAYELWSAGGRQRYCDGSTCLVTYKQNLVEQDCMCDPENRECNLVSRFDFLIPDLPDIGVWTLESHGYHAATEFAASVEMVAGRQVEANLGIEHREVKRPGQPTRKFIVPVLKVPVSLRQVMAGGGPLPLLGGGAVAAALPAPANKEDNVTVTESPPVSGTREITENPIVRQATLEDHDEILGKPDDLEDRRRAQIEALKASVVEVDFRKVGEDRSDTDSSSSAAGDQSDETPSTTEPIPHALAQKLKDAEAAAADEWTGLGELLVSAPKSSLTMDEIEVKLRELFRRMERTELWPPNKDGVDALHLALKKRGWDHVGDMRKAELVKFSEEAWEGARQAYDRAQG